MIDCGNTEIRELLPDMLHDSLSPADRQRVAAHMSSCAACQEEFALLSSVHAIGAARSVNVSAIAGAIKPYRRRPWMSVPPLMRIAASIGIVAVGSLSYSIVSKTIDEGDAGIGESAVATLPSDTTVPAVTTSSDPLSASSDLNSLDDQAIQELLAQLAKLDAAIGAEPKRVVRTSSSGN